MSVAAHPPRRAAPGPPGRYHEEAQPPRGMPSSSSSKNQRLAQALGGPSHPYAFPRTVPSSKTSVGASGSSASSLAALASLDAPATRQASLTSSPSEYEDQFRDVEEDFEDVIDQHPPSHHNDAGPSARASVDTHWDENEFQKHAADRMSKYSVATRYDGEDDDYGGDDGVEPYGASPDDYDAKSTFGHARNSSVGSSIWAGRGAVTNSTYGTPSSRKKRTPNPPPLPTSSAALQQLRSQQQPDAHLNGASEAPLTPSLDAGFEDGGERGPMHLAVNGPSTVNGLHSAYNSPNPSDYGQAIGTPGSIGDEFELVNAPLPDHADRAQASSLPRKMSDGMPYPPLPPMPDRAYSPPRKAGSKGPASAKKKGSPTLSTESDFEEEERLKTSPAVGLGDEGGDASFASLNVTGENNGVERRISHLGPKLRKHEPAPWEIETRDDASDAASATSSPFPPPSPNTQSAWSRITRGSLDVREKEGGDTRRTLGLGVSLRRPSGEMRRPSGDHAREGSRGAQSPRMKSRFKSLGGQGVEPPLPTEASHNSLGLAHSPSGSVGTTSGSIRNQPSSSLAPNAYAAPPVPHTPESIYSVSSVNSSKQRLRAKSVSNSAASVLKGLGLGGGDKKAKPEGPQYSNKLAKALKKKGERDELSLAKGISSENYRQLPADGDVQGDAEDPAHHAAVRADANKNLANPFAAVDQGSPAPSVMSSTASRLGVNHPEAGRSSASLQPGTPTSQQTGGGASPALSHTTDKLPTTPQHSQSGTAHAHASSGLPSSPTGKASIPGGWSRASLTTSDSQHSHAQSHHSSSGTSAQGQTPSMRSHAAFHAQDPSTNASFTSHPPVSSPRNLQRQLSLSNSASVTSHTGSLGGISHGALGMTSSPVPARGMGIGYRKANGFTSPPPSANAGVFQRSPMRQESAGSVRSRPSPHSPVIPEDSSLDSMRSNSATPTAGIIGMQAASLAQQEVAERRQSPATTTASSSAGTAASSIGGASGTYTGQSASIDTNATSPRVTPLPTPGSHEGVSYKLISLEQAQAQQLAKAKQHAAMNPGSVNDSKMSSLPSQGHINGADADNANKDKLPSSGSGTMRSLKSKKSGLLRMFNRGNSSHADDDAPSMPESQTVKSFDTAALSAAGRVESGLPSMTSSPSTSKVGLGGPTGSDAKSPPALGALRPVSSMFSSLSPVLLDEESERPALPSHPTAALAALQGERPAQQAAASKLPSPTTELPNVKSNQLGVTRGHVPAAINPAPYGATETRGAAASGEALKSPAEESVTGEFYSPASSPMRPDLNNDGTDTNVPPAFANAGLSEYSVTKPLQLVNKQHQQQQSRGPSGSHGAAVVTANDAFGPDAVRSSTHSGEADSEASSLNPALVNSFPSVSAMGRAGGTMYSTSSGQGAVTPSTAAVRGRVSEIEAQMGELLAELTHLRATRLPNAHVPCPNLAAATSQQQQQQHAGEGSEGEAGAEQSGGPIPACHACGCNCAEMKRLQALNELEVLKHLGTGSGGGGPSGGSVLDRGRGVKRREEEGSRFGAKSGR